MLVFIRGTAAVFVVIPSHGRSRNIALPFIINGFCVPLFLSAFQSVQQAINARLKLGGHLISCRVAAGWGKELTHGAAGQRPAEELYSSLLRQANGDRVVSVLSSLDHHRVSSVPDAEMLPICLLITAVSSRRLAYRSDRGWVSIN